MHDADAENQQAAAHSLDEEPSHDACVVNENEQVVLRKGGSQADEASESARLTSAKNPAGF